MSEMGDQRRLSDVLR
jgi:hypothetical protein